MKRLIEQTACDHGLYFGCYCKGSGSREVTVDIEAAKQAMRDTPGVTLLLARILELAGMPMEQVMVKELGGFALMLENHTLRTRKVREAIAAALGGGL